MKMYRQYLPFKPGFHIVVTVAEHACDYVLKRILKLLICRLQSLKNVFPTVCLRSLRQIYGEYSDSVRNTNIGTEIFVRILNVEARFQYLNGFLLLQHT